MTTPDEAAVVPIELTVGEKTGYTIWAPPWIEDGEEWQAFLGADGKVWLFESLDDLAATLSSTVTNDLDDHPRWPMLQTLPAGQLVPDPDYRYDLDAVPGLTEQEATEEVVEQVAETVDIVERIAECCDHGTLLRLLEQPGFADLLGDGSDLDDDLDEDDDEDEDDEPDDDDDEDDDDTEVGDLDDGSDPWEEIGDGIRTAWPLLLDRFADCISWRTAADLPEAAEDEDDAEEGAEVNGDRAFWDGVGILPIELRLPSGAGYTLRCYVDDEPRFLGTDMVVDLFRTKEALQAFIAEEDEHDLSGLDTWDEVKEQEDLDVTPPADERFDLTTVDAQLIGGPGVADLKQVRACVDTVLDLAEYCELAGVQAALADDAPVGSAISDLFRSAGGSLVPTYRSGDGAAAQWRTLIDEVDTCVRWHD